MLPLESADWASLTQAYGSAVDIPALLRRAPLDFEPGHKHTSTWFSLWSSLCHQGDAYTASYAAVPHLLAIAAARVGTEALFDPLHLSACIELSRLEGQGPPLPSSLRDPYLAALALGRQLASEAQSAEWPAGYREALRGSEAAFAGRAEEARAIFDQDGDEDVFEEDRLPR